MYKVLLVDDEKFVRKGLRVLIDWEDCGFTIMGEADNGQKALDMMQNSLPDLVLVDIRMPVMGGLELIEEANRRFDKRIKFIILSGYNEFEYAQKAIQNDVKQYILKPIDENELIPLLDKIKNELQTEREQEKEHNLLRKIRNSKILYENVCKQSQVNEVAMLDNFSIEKNKQFYCLLMSAQKAISDDSSLILFVINLLNSHTMLKFEIMEDNYHNICLFIQYEKIDITHTVKQLSQLMQKSSSRDFTICTSDVLINEKDNLVKAYQHAIIAQKNLFYNTGYSNYSYIHNCKKLGDLKVRDCFAPIIEMIENNQVNSIESTMQKILDDCKNAYVDPELLRNEINKLVYDISSLASQISREKDNIAVYKHDLYNFKFNKLDVGTLHQKISEFCIEQAAYIDKLQKEKQSGIAGKVKKYLDQNYTMDINLKKIAEMFYVNSIYLGQLFKKNYDMKFTDYLNSVRVKESKKLLRNTNYSVSEIAGIVGYSNTEYFIKKFYGIVGTTPNKYRKHKSMLDGVNN
jgi:two-component system response regulator YesN